MPNIQIKHVLKYKNEKVGQTQCDPAISSLIDLSNRSFNRDILLHKYSSLGIDTKHEVSQP